MLEKHSNHYASPASAGKPPDSHYLTHQPTHPGCEACCECKMQRKHMRSKTGAMLKRFYEGKGPWPDEPNEFGDGVAVHNIMVPEDMGLPLHGTPRH